MDNLKTLLLAAVVAVVTSVVTVTIMSGSDVNGSAGEDLDVAVGEVLENNPKLVQGAIFNYLHTQELEQMLPIMNDFAFQLADDPTAGFTGNPEGDVTIVEFLDYRCGYCRRDHEFLNEILAEDGNIKLLVKQYPILDREDEDPLSLWSAFAAYYAIKHDKFEIFHEEMMRRPKPSSMEDIMSVITFAGLDAEEAEKAVRDFEGIDKLQINLALGQQLSIRGTPFYIIGDDFARGAQTKEKILKLIKAAREL